MIEPSRRTSRLALAAGLASAFACAAGGFVAGRITAPAPTPPPAAAAATPVTSPEPEPTPSPETAPAQLSRADLIKAARAAADAHARAAAPPPELAVLDGRRFAIRLPFGCTGPSAGPETVPGWRYDADRGVLRVQVPRVHWAPPIWVPADAAGAVDDLVGFWIARPWTSAETCSPDAGDDVGAPSIQTLGLASYVARDAARRGRGAGKDYAVTKRIDAEALRTDGGFRLALTGRVTTGPGGETVTCRSLGGRNAQPTCLIAVTIATVTIENGATGEELGTWEIPAAAPTVAPGADARAT